MGNTLFGVDIAGVVKDAFAGQLLTATLHSIAYGARNADTTTGLATVETNYTCEGIIDEYTKSRPDGDVERGDKKVLLIANSINGGSTSPKMGDEVTIEGMRLKIVSIPERDPAAATWTLQCRRT